MNILFMTSAVPPNPPMHVEEKKPPLGIGFILAILKQAGHTVYFRDEFLAPTNILDTDFLWKYNIEMVGIYANTICYPSTMKLFERLQHYREQGHWKGKIMVGGPHTSIGVETIPEYVDYVVQGEGEITVLDIINGSLQSRVVVGKPVKDLDVLPIPAWEEFIFLPYNWKDKLGNQMYPLYNMNTSRGCPYNCTFCSVKGVWGKNYRYMSAERVIDEICYLKKYYGTQGIYFREDHFTLNKKRTIEFCETLLKKNIHIKWMCESRIDSLQDPKYLKLLARSGCQLFYLGVESGSQRMLDYYQKGITVDQIIETFDLIRQAGIKTYASFIEGVPYETEEDRQKTQELIQQIKPDFLGINPYVGLPGSQIYDDIKRNRLYEYENEDHVLYVKGHNKRVDTYWADERYKIPGSQRSQWRIHFKNKILHLSLYKILKKLEQYF